MTVGSSRLDDVLEGVGRCRRAVHLGQLAALLVMGIAGAGGDVHHVVQDRRGPGRLAEGGIAVGMGRAGAIREGRGGACGERGQYGRRRAVRVPLHRVGRPGVVVADLVVIIEAGDIVQTVGRAEQLGASGSPDAGGASGEAVAAEGAVRLEYRADIRAGAIVILALLEMAVGGDGAQLQTRAELPAHMQAHAPGAADAGLLRHADAGLVRAVRLHDVDQGERGGGVVLGQQLDVIGGRRVIGIIGVEQGAEIAAGLHSAAPWMPRRSKELKSCGPGSGLFTVPPRLARMPSNFRLMLPKRGRSRRVSLL